MFRAVLCSIALAFLAACGQGPSDNTSSGSISGASFSAPFAIYNIKENYLIRDQLAVLITDDQSACAHLVYETDSAEQPFVKTPDGAGGFVHSPSLWMRMTDHSGIVSDQRGINDDLHASFDPGAPANDLCATSSCQGHWLSAVKGTSDIDSSTSTGDSEASAKGDFYLTFGGGQQISGTFKAVACPELKVSGCSAGGAGLFPALSLLALLAFRRRSTIRA